MARNPAEDEGGGRPRRLGPLNLLTLGAGIAALVTGVIGWTISMQPPAFPAGLGLWADIAVRSIKSLLLSDIYFDPGPGPGGEPYRVNAWLEASRALGLLFSLLLAGRVVLFAARSQISRVAIARRRGHDVVLGSGLAAVIYPSVAHGSATTRVAAGLDTRDGRHARVERAGAVAHQLKSAGAARARRIIVDEGEDAATWEVAQDAARAYPRAEVLAHIGDPWLIERLDRADAATGLRAFSYAGGAARQVMLAHPPYLLARALGAPAQHILIVGFGSVGQALARDCLTTSVAGAPVDMRITVIDPDIARLQADFRARHPGLETWVGVNWLAGDIRRIDDTLADAIRAHARDAEICAVYVAIADERLPLSTGAALRDIAGRLGLFRAPIFLCAPTGAGLPAVRQGAGLVGAASQGASRVAIEARALDEGLLCDLRMVSFGAWDAALDGAGLLEPHLDEQARRFHESYRQLILASDPAAADRPTMRPWEALPDEFRVSNRRVAAHVRAKLDAAGYDIGAWLASAPGGRLTHDLPPAPDVLSDLDAASMDRLGELEHRRWMMDRLLSGWRFGTPRDDLRKLHPDLKPNYELDEPAREKDRGNIRETARMLKGMIAQAHRKR